MSLWIGEFSLLDSSSGQATLRLITNQSNIGAATSAFAAVAPFLAQATNCAIQSIYVLQPVNFIQGNPGVGTYGFVPDQMMMQLPTSLSGVFYWLAIPAPVNLLVNTDVNRTLNISGTPFTNLYSAMRSNNCTDQMGNALVSNPEPTGVMITRQYNVLLSKSVALMYNTGAMGSMAIGSAKIQ